MVAHVFDGPRSAMSMPVDRGGPEPREWWKRRSGPPARVRSAAELKWEALERSWDCAWQGVVAGSGGAHATDDAESCCSGHCRSDDGSVAYSVASTMAWSVASTASASSKRIMNKLVSWIREKQDARRGIVYTKTGPCNLFEDLPIPPYPEDYDWCMH
ncbi:unnamed protein product [Ostreobium quekettii]|uniref:Uncharacterized protein n=1 Tax=Ostreobium quekettii TaxID=121088 RepID=A0A8S1IV22_9CHLO|nr:unnamed protein product [Ostreobium quekettii]|eukprot:evm.model.scf_906EXC.4 EVM.evm.TU.scf_906EXC.4   scf_906EXC:34325-36295(-)